MNDSNWENNKKEAIDFYNIIQNRQINEDRILAERTSLFLLSNSFLFLGFVTLFSIAYVLSIIITIIGLFLCLFMFRLNQLSIQQLNYLHFNMREFEQNSLAFSFMREKKITPHIPLEVHPSLKENWLLRKLTVSSIHIIWIPLILAILWVCSLIWMIFLR